MKIKKKGNQIIKIRKKLKDDFHLFDGFYVTKYKDIKKYFKFFNKIIFKNELLPFNDIEIKRLKKALGQCVEYYCLSKGTKSFTLEMNYRYKNKKDFLETLVHEMIHFWQQTIKRDNGNHNELFFSFRPKLKKIGLNLTL